MPEIPVFHHDLVLGAISPLEAIERVREGFVEYAGGEWQMPPKVYLYAADGDFRAMPAQGGGLAILKWVTSFPGNPAAGLPVVMGMICVSSAEDGRAARPRRRALGDGAAHRGGGSGRRTGARARGRVDGRDRRLRPARRLGGALLGRRGVRAGHLLRPRSRVAGALAGELGWEAGGLGTRSRATSSPA